MITNSDQFDTVIIKPIYKLLEWISEDKIYWCELSKNPSAIHLLEKNQNNIDWSWLSSKPKAIHLLEKNQNKINWNNLSQNPGTIKLLEKNPDKINWYWLSRNAAIFELDTDAMRKRMQPLAEELMTAVFHPRRVGRIMNEYGYNIGTDEMMNE